MKFDCKGLVATTASVGQEEAAVFVQCFVLEWVLLFRWYQPDLASYMQKTISSMDKLRTLMEQGESAAYACGELIMEGDDWEGKNENETFSTPLLG